MTEPKRCATNRAAFLWFHETVPKAGAATMTHAFAKPLSALPSGALRGRVVVPGDKSISHRSLMLGALTIGETRIAGLLESADVMATAAAMRAFGAKVEKGADGSWRVRGLGTGTDSAERCAVTLWRDGCLSVGCGRFAGHSSARARPSRTLL